MEPWTVTVAGCSGHAAQMYELRAPPLVSATTCPAGLAPRGEGEWDCQGRLSEECDTGSFYWACSRSYRCAAPREETSPNSGELRPEPSAATVDPHPVVPSPGALDRYIVTCEPRSGEIPLEVSGKLFDALRKIEGVQGVWAPLRRPVSTANISFVASSDPPLDEAIIRRALEADGVELTVTGLRSQRGSPGFALAGSWWGGGVQGEKISLFVRSSTLSELRSMQQAVDRVAAIPGVEAAAFEALVCGKDSMTPAQGHIRVGTRHPSRIDEATVKAALEGTGYDLKKILRSDP